MLHLTEHFRQRCAERGITGDDIAPAIARRPRYSGDGVWSYYASGVRVVATGSVAITAVRPRTAWIKRAWARMPMWGEEL